MDIINNYLMDNCEFAEIPKHGKLPTVTKHIECNDGFKISVQASKYHYCAPRESFAWPYTHVELGYPIIEDELINEYAENPEYPTGTVYPMVPIDIVVKLIEKHGGIANG